MIDINESYITDDLDMLSEIFNPVEEKTIKLEEGENRVVSILFLDVNGFTSMSEKMGSENTKRTMDKILTTFTNSIIKYGGYIDKYEGDLIMALFGSKITSETDTERAINAGLKILTDLKHINKITNFDLSIRIGINTGEVTTGKIGMKREGDFTVYGDAVNLAARMESNAPLNSIMIPKDTKEIIKDYFIFEDLGIVEVKGKEKPISIFKVIKKNPNKVERWERNSKIISRSIYVGRDKELNKIVELYETSKKEINSVDENYKPIIVGLRGDAGLGKSRLVREFVKKKNISKFLSGYTKSFAQPAYTIWVTMLKKYFSIEDDNSKELVKEKLDESFKELISYFTSDAGVEKLLIGAKNVIGYLFGVKYNDSRLIKVEPKTLQTFINTSMRYTIEAIAYKVNMELEIPLVIYFDDCQWMDEPSQGLLKTFLATLNVEEKRGKVFNRNILFLLTYRPEFRSFKEFEFDSRFTEFKLNPLTVDYSKKLIDSMLGTHNLSNLFIEKTVENSGGNPFYIEELVSYLIEDSKIIRDEKIQSWKLSGKIENIHIPLSLNNIILSRIDNLKSELKVVLQRASVIGHHFFKIILKEVSKKIDNHDNNIDKSFIELLDDKWVLPEEEEQKGSKSFDERDIYRFKQILTSDVCYGSILMYNKKILHKVIAETSEEIFNDNKEYYSFIANHYEKAKVEDKTIEYLLKAGDFAKENYQNDEAVIFYDKLLNPDLGLSKNSQIDIYFKKGEIFELTGRWDEAIDILEKAYLLSDEIENKEKLAKSSGIIGGLFRLKGKYEKAMESFQKQLRISEELGVEGGISRARGDIGLIYHMQGNFVKAMENYEKQLVICKKLGNIRGISRAIGNIGVVHHAQGNYDKAMEFYKKILDIYDKVDDKRGISKVVGNIGIIYHIQGNYVEAMNSYERALRTSIELGDRQGISRTSANMAAIYKIQGNYEKAMESYIKQLKIREDLGDNLGYSKIIGNMAAVYRSQGNCNKAMECYEKGLKIKEEIGDKQGISMFFGYMGMISKNQGEFAKGIEYLDKALEIDYEINLKSFIPYHLYQKILCSEKLGNFQIAMDLNDELFKTANEISDILNIFNSKVINEKIGFNLNIGDSEKQLQNISNLKQFLKEENEETNIVLLSHEIAVMLHNINRDYFKYKDKAIEIYKSLYKKIPDIEYKIGYEELEKL